MTIPNLLFSFEEKVIVNRLKESYSILNQAYKMASEEYGPVSTWNPDGVEELTSTDIVEHLTQFLKNYHLCTNTNKPCGGHVFTYLTGEKVDYYYPITFVLHNSSQISIFGNKNISTGNPIISQYIYAKECDSVCTKDQVGPYTMDKVPVIIITVTGAKFPKSGKDVFQFALLDRGIVPFGDVGANGNRFCNPTGSSKPGWVQGGTCAAWVIKRGNLDYLRCVRGNQKYCTGNYKP